MMSKESESKREVCRGCGEEIDPSVCWCGSEPEKHSPWHDSHVPVPMGCLCLTGEQEGATHDHD